MPFLKLSYLNVLRDEEIYPPFAEIEELVLTHDTSKRSLAIFAQPAVEALLIALLAIAVLWKPEQSENRSGARSETIVSNTIVPNSLAQQKAPVTNSVENSTSLGIQRNAPNPAAPGNNFTANDKAQIISNSDTIRSQKQTLLDPIAGALSSSSSIASSSTPPVSTSIVSPLEESGNRNQWEGFVAGALMVPPSGIPANAYSKPFNATIGLRYILTPQSSLLLEVRKNSFISSTSHTMLSDSAASVVLDGQTFHNEIGSTASVSNYSSESVWSLDFGYHYLLFSNASLTPFAEVLAGGSFSGVVTSELLGAEYSLSSFFFDAGLRADQLFAAGSLPRRSLTAEAAVGFMW